MVRHMVLWTLKDMPMEEKAAVKNQIKEKLEALQGKIPGLISIQVITEVLDTTNGDVLLNSTLESEQALLEYQVHEEHQKAASYVRSVVSNRICIDYNEI